ncbi:MAG: 50S ribosomal protein L24 [Pseudomonadota bacterium]|nr:50S ribosomal protein L24 [Pseudomonadota bacterium]
MALAKIKQGIEVIVLTGKYKGKTGQVLKVFAEKNKVLVEGINLATFHQKPNPNAQIEGGIKKKELPIDISNVARYDSNSGKAMKLGVKSQKDSKKVFFNKKTETILDN